MHVVFRLLLKIFEYVASKHASSCSAIGPKAKLSEQASMGFTAEQIIYYAHYMKIQVGISTLLQSYLTINFNLIYYS